MATYDFRLEDYPDDKRRRELWLQHAAGLIIFEDARQYAIKQMDRNLDDGVKAEVIKGIDDAVYGMMMIFDGVTGALDNAEFTVHLETKVVLKQKPESGDRVLLDQVDLQHGDGMCMGYHGWLEGDFGEDKVASKA